VGEHTQEHVAQAAVMRLASKRDAQIPLQI
jgi:hypothetical protein